MKTKCISCAIYDHRKYCMCDCYKCTFFLKNKNHCGYCNNKDIMKCETCKMAFLFKSSLRVVEK